MVCSYFSQSFLKQKDDLIEHQEAMLRATTYRRKTLEILPTNRRSRKQVTREMKWGTKNQMISTLERYLI